VPTSRSTARSLSSSSPAIAWLEWLGHAREHVALARRERVERARRATPVEHPRDDLGVERRAALADLPDGVREPARVGDAVLEQVADALRALAEQVDGVGLLGVLGEHEHTRAGQLGADRPRRAQALVGVRRRHPDVGDRHVRSLRADVPQQLVGIARLADDVEAGRLQQVDDPDPQQHRVLGDDHAHAARRGRSRRWDAGAGHRGERLAREHPGRRVTVLALLGHRTPHHVFQAARQIWPRVAQRRRRVVEVREHLLQIAAAVERRGPRERLEQQAGERVDVGTAVDVAASRLLGRHVVSGAHREAGLGQAVVGLLALGQPEVGQERVLAPLAAGDQDIARLDVAMHQTVPMRLVERARHLRDEPDGSTGIER